MEYLIVKWLHVLSSTVLFGTGLGSAFYMFFTNRSTDVRAIAIVCRRVVWADWAFTTPTAILQPATGFYLVHLAHMPLESKWIGWSLGLYALAGACWLPVVWMQIRMAAMAERAVAHTAFHAALAIGRDPRGIKKDAHARQLLRASERSDLDRVAEAVLVAAAASVARVALADERTPFQHVVQLNENVPGPKTEAYFHDTRDGKLLLRKVMSRYVPDEITNQV